VGAVLSGLLPLAFLFSQLKGACRSGRVHPRTDQLAMGPNRASRRTERWCGWKRVPVCNSGWHELRRAVYSYLGKIISLGAQTFRPGDARPVGVVLSGLHPPAYFLLLRLLPC
jgi:hypothetical protein